MTMLGFDADDEVPTDHRGRPLPPGHRPSRVRGLTATLVALAVLVGGGAAAYAGLHSLVSGRSAVAAPVDYPGPGTGSVTVVVAPGETVAQIASSLVAARVVAAAAPFVAAAGATSGGTAIQPATYRLRSHMSSQGALALLLDPASRTGSTSVPEGQRLSVTLAAIARTTGIGVAQLRAAAADRTAIGLPAWAIGGAEGFLFPATYQFPKGAPATTVLRTMVARFDTAATAVGLTTGARAVGRTPYQVLVVASLLQAEVPDAANQAKVARVLYNRLAKGQPLELDSTVKYAAGSNGTVFTTAAERRQASPYNTYLHAGLPPGPIDSPGQQALQAALHPAPGPWLYYVTVDLATGRTLYSTTLAGQQHNAGLLATWCRAHRSAC